MTNTPLHQRIRARSATVYRLASRWWAWPVRRYLHRLQAEMIAWAADAQQIENALNEVVEDAREHAQAVERHISIAGAQAVLELDQIVAGWRKGGVL